MRDNASVGAVQRKYATAFRTVFDAPPADRLDLTARRSNAVLMADILQEIHGDEALSWALRMENQSNRTAFARLVRIELERRGTAG